MPDDLHRTSLPPLLARPQARTDKPAITQTRRGKLMGYSIRTARNRYTVWDNGSQGEELYDYKKDPREIRNLAGESAAAPLRKSLRAQLQAILDRRGKPSGSV